MGHTCTWNANYPDWNAPGRTCGAPATKCVRLTSHNKTYRAQDEDGKVTTREGCGKIIWLCDEHYASPHPWGLWRGLVVEA